MLVICKRLSDLRWSELMAVYAEGNEENGAEFFSHLSKNEQLLQAEQSFYDYLKRDFFARPEDRYCIWQEQGRYVAALRLHPYGDGLLLEALETRPEYRRRGYAERLIKAVQMEFQPQKLYSHIGHKNAASIAVHLKCGFVKIADTARYLDGSVNAYCGTYLYNA